MLIFIIIEFNLILTFFFSAPQNQKLNVKNYNLKERKDKNHSSILKNIAIS